MKHTQDARGRARCLARTSAAVAATLTLLVAAGCGGGESSRSSNQKDGLPAAKQGEAAVTTPPEATTTKPAGKPEFITVRAYAGEYQKALARTAGRQFTKDTGVKVKWDTTDEFVSFTKIAKQIRDGRRPDADASLQAQQRAYLDTARGLSLPISAELAPNLEKANRAVAAPPGASESATTWAYVNPYSVTVPFIVNKKLVDPASVTSWNDLTSSRFRKALIFDQIYSSTAFGLAKAMGVDPAANPPASLDPVWKRVEQIRPNLTTLGNGTDVTTALAQGTGKLAVSCSCSYNDAASTGATLEVVAPKDGLYEVSDSYYIHRGIPAENYYYAQVFANYLFNNETQSELASSQSLIPVVADAKLPAFMTDRPKVFPVTPEQQQAANVVLAPIPLMARNDTTWQQAFESAIK